MYVSFFKPCLDFIFALILLIIFSPFLLIVYLLILVTSKRSPLFVQPRTGKNGKLFRIFKFKTMNDKRDRKGQLLPDVERLTRLGSFVRKSSLDEIPQLLNVLKGDMSFIGPRPLLPEYLPYYKKEESLRHSVHQGITGLAQVLGRNNLSWDDKLKLDVEYVQKVSLKLDLYIFLMTIKKVVACKDVVVLSSVNTNRLDYERKENI